MDPVSLGIAAIGLGMQVFGAFKGSEDAAKASQISKDEAKQEQAINDQKQKAMEVDARRKQLEIIRTSQQAQALATSRATNQNAQFGSGLQGGLAEVEGQSAFNLQGVNNSLEIGRNINTLNRNISNDKMQMADVQSSQATDAAFMSLGGTIMKAGPFVGQLSQGLGFSSSFGNFSGTPGAKNTGGLY